MTREEREEPYIEVIEVQRGRWQRARERRGMASVLDKSFARLGSSVPAQDLSVRFLIMPSDPDSLQVRFTNDFWEWWQNPPTDPFGDSITSFGSYHRPGADAAITWESDSRASDVWREYISLSRAGEFEFGLTTSGANSVGERRYFFLTNIVGTNIVGRIWVALSRYALFAQKFSPAGPFEASLAMVDTAGSILCNFATGWRDPLRGNSFDDYPTCTEEHLLFRREVRKWPEAEDCKELSLEFAERIVNSWGIKEPRFLAHSGEWEGKFDVSRYSR